jgi:predicted GNAT family acetyltransferase
MTDDLRPTGDPDVHDHPAKLRYEIQFDGKVAGFAQYTRHGADIVFTHTEIEPDVGGHGLGGRLATAVLDDARDRGLGVVPQCPFIAAYIEKHPDYADLVTTT